MLVSVLGLTGCERTLPTDPAPATFDFATTASTATVALVSDGLVPLWQSCCTQQGTSLPWYEDVRVPAGNYTIDYRIEGTIRFIDTRPYPNVLAEEFGPGGSSGYPQLLWRQPGDGAVILSWWPARGRPQSYVGEPGPNPVYSTSFQVRGPGTLRLARTSFKVGLGFIGNVEGESQRFTIHATPIAQASVQLNCSGDLGPNRVTRGKEVVCTARKNPDSAPGAVTVSGWSFEGTPRTDGDRTSLEWRGIMVKSGRVEVRGKVGNGPEQPASAQIEVIDRTWSDMPVIHLLELPATGGEPRVDPLAEKIMWASDLGEFTPFLEPPQGEELADVIGFVDGGPNDGIHYFVDLSFPVWARIRINLAAMTEGSGFYRAQERTRRSSNQIGGASWCSNRIVSRDLPGLVGTHERRHVEVYREVYSSVVGPLMTGLEQMTGSYTDLADRYEPLRRKADKDAMSASKNLDSKNHPDMLRFSENGRECELMNEEGDVLTNEPEEPGQ